MAERSKAPRSGRGLERGESSNLSVCNTFCLCVIALLERTFLFPFWTHLPFVAAQPLPRSTSPAESIDNAQPWQLLICHFQISIRLAKHINIPSQNSNKTLSISYPLYSFLFQKSILWLRSIPPNYEDDILADCRVVS